ncbi:MAG: hypothetical protein IPG45_34225 [Deltaproteobacteria bacterium]|jgi:hypothetical protein|nr:hypothetical protein [Deltaproteobacteria bacterium]
MSATIHSIPAPTLTYDCLKPNLDKGVTRKMDSQMWGPGSETPGLTTKDEYANRLPAEALKGVGKATAKRLQRLGLKDVASVAYAAREQVVAAGATAAQRATLGRVHDALRVCTGDVWIMEGR